MICAVFLAVEGGLSAPAASASTPGSAAEIVSRYGLRPVDPPTPSSEFQLPDLAGGERALSDFQGRWVVLTFWATWCGPCRAEMPSLERLHANRSSRGLAVVGVSVDTLERKAESFIESYGLTFPNLWDARGRAASAYRAQTIPLSYVIDPIGRIVAVSVGARDWMALQPMLDELLALELDAGLEPQYEIAEGPVELPMSFQPPTAEAQLLDPAPEANEPFAVEVRVRWAGNFDDYLLHPPRLHLPDQVVQEAQSASTSSADGRSLVTYRIELRAAEAGRYALHPVELVYTPRNESEPISSRVDGPTVDVVPATVLGITPRAMALAGAVLLALTLAGWALLRRRRARRAEPVATESAATRWKGGLERVRRLRMEGDLRRAVLALTEIEMELGATDESEREALEARAEGARYGGYNPTREEVESIERRVARRVKEVETDPREAAREALHLRNQEI